MAFAQGLARQAARERLALVMSSDFFKRRSGESFKVLPGDENPNQGPQTVRPAGVVASLNYSPLLFGLRRSFG